MCCKGTKKKWTDQIVVSLLFHLFLKQCVFYQQFVTSIYQKAY